MSGCDKRSLYLPQYNTKSHASSWKRKRDIMKENDDVPKEAGAFRNLTAARKLPQNSSRKTVEDLKRLVFPGEIQYVLTAIGAEAAICEILQSRPAVVGLDLEWRVMFTPGAPPRRTATLQLCCSPDKGYVLHVFYTGWPPSLKKLLTDPDIIKAGVNITGDFYRITVEGVCCYSEIQGIGELTTLARAKSIPDHFCSVDYGLQGLCGCVLGKYLPKPQHLRVGNWEQKPLGMEQLLYAVTDAYASLRVYEALLKFEDLQPSKSESSNGHNKFEGRDLKQPFLLDSKEQESFTEVVAALPDTLCKRLGASKREVNRLFHKESLSMAAIALRQGIKVSTVQNYLAECIQAGYSYDWAKFDIPKDVEDAVNKMRNGASANKIELRMKTVKEALPQVQFWQIKVCLAHLQRRAECMAESPEDDLNSCHGAGPSKGKEQGEKITLRLNQNHKNPSRSMTSPSKKLGVQSIPEEHGSSSLLLAESLGKATNTINANEFKNVTFRDDEKENKRSAEKKVNEAITINSAQAFMTSPKKLNVQESVVENQEDGYRNHKHSCTSSLGFFSLNDVDQLQEELGPLTQLN